VGSERVAIIDPGPDVEDHVRALVVELGTALEVRIVVTHGHSDHSGAARRLSDALGAAVYGPGSLSMVDVPLADGDRLPTDAGDLVAVHTPGHAAEHLCFHWPDRRALFVGDVMLGTGDTTYVASYSGCVADYLDSLQRMRTLDVDVLYPAHGPPILDPGDAFDRYEAHRLARIRQAREALAAMPEASVEELLDYVYGPTLAIGMRVPAARSLSALMDYINGTS